VDHLYGQKRASSRTVQSYRDTFRLLLQFLRETTGKEPAALVMSDIDAPTVLKFLDYLEGQRRNQAQSRNVRLAAIRSFCRMVALRDPASVGIATRVLSIPVKRADKRLVRYLTRPEIDAMLAAHDLTDWMGRRDHALLLTLYNTGARVSEITGLQRTNVKFGIKSFVQFTGKGRKERAVPLWPTTTRVLRAWFQELESEQRYATVAFPNARGKALSRHGVDYLLQECVERAQPPGFGKSDSEVWEENDNKANLMDYLGKVDAHQRTQAAIAAYDAGQGLAGQLKQAESALSKMTKPTAKY
jgi:integrase/recombinase XerD